MISITRYLTAQWLEMMALLLLCAATAQAQQNENRLLTKAFVAPVAPEPLEISNLKVNGASINIGQPFAADDEWIKGLSFDIKNVSGKTITHFKIGLRLHNPINDKRASVFVVFHGRDTGLPNVEPTVHVMPGEVIHAVYSERLYEGFKRMCEHIELKKVTEASIGIDMVVFDDDTAWRNGSLHRRDHSSPMRWLVIDRNNLIPNLSPGQKTKQ